MRKGRAKERYNNYEQRNNMHYESIEMRIANLPGTLAQVLPLCPDSLGSLPLPL